MKTIGATGLVILAVLAGDAFAAKSLMPAEKSLDGMNHRGSARFEQEKADRKKGGKPSEAAGRWAPLVVPHIPQQPMIAEFPALREAEAWSGPNRPGRFMIDRDGQIWDRGYINYRPTTNEITPIRPGAPMVEIYERWGGRRCSKSSW